MADVKQFVREICNIYGKRLPSEVRKAIKGIVGGIGGITEGDNPHVDDADGR